MDDPQTTPDSCRVEQSLMLVKRMLNYLRSTSHAVRKLDYDDAYQIGAMALVLADRQFRPGTVGHQGKTASFDTYAMAAIRRHIFNAALRDAGVIHVPQHARYRDAAFKARKVKSLSQTVYTDLANFIADRETSSENNPCEDKQWLAHRLLAFLTADQQKLLRLYFWDNLTQDEIAQKMGKTRSSISVKIRSLIDQLRDLATSTGETPC